MPKSKKLFIFDLDGTLIHFPTEYILSHAEKIIAELKRPEVSKTTLKEHFANFDFFSFVEKENRDFFEEKFWEKFDWVNYSEHKPIQGVEKALAKLSQLNKEMAIATSRLCCPNDLKKELENTNFGNYINLITTKSDPNTCFKDKTIQLNQIFNHFSTEPKDAVMVGDIPPDISYAKEFGVGMTIAVLSGGIKREILEKENPDFILKDVGNLVDLFK